MNDIIPENFKIAIVGAGNVATRLGLAAKEKGFRIAGVASRTVSSAKALAERLSCPALADISEIPVDCDLVLIATTDTAVAGVAAAIPPVKGIVAHTSGSVPLETLAAIHERAAVISPLQTFSRDVEVDVSEVPFFTEATDAGTLAVADSFAQTLSRTCSHADSAIRAKLHVAGVLSSNFPIYLLGMTEKVLAEAGLPLSTVHPLVKASISKAFEVGPHDALTGPARRGDVKVLNKQLSSLSDPAAKAIYEAISDAILKEYHQNLLP